MRSGRGKDDYKVLSLGQNGDRFNTYKEITNFNFGLLTLSDSYKPVYMGLITTG